MLLRIPGIGVRSVQRILSARRHRGLRLEDLGRLGVSLKKCSPFLTTIDYHPQPSLLEGDRLRQRFLPPPKQLELDFAQPAADPDAARSALNGEI
jgi:predicted DNA-binding helix-hairpin-helix protein